MFGAEYMCVWMQERKWWDSTVQAIDRQKGQVSPTCRRLA